MRYGLVFKLGDEVVLAEYDGEGNPHDQAHEISDFDGIYETLKQTQFSLVEITSKIGEAVRLRDLTAFSITNHDDSSDYVVSEIIAAGDLPDLMKSIYEKMILTGDYKNAQPGSVIQDVA